MITVEVKQNAQDYLRSQRLHFRPRPWVRGVFWTIAVLIALSVAEEVWVIAHGGVLARGWWLVPLAIAYGVFLFVFFLPWRISKIFRDNPNLAKPTQTTLAPEGLLLATTRGQIRMPWALIKGWKVNSQMLLIYQSRVNFSAYPKRCFASEADFAAWVEALEKNVGPATR